MSDPENGVELAGPSTHKVVLFDEAWCFHA